jgi:hypothetical protein
MATVFESISLNGIRLSHLRQLASYVHERDESGWYYGNKVQFEKRHADIVRWIDGAVEYAELEGVKMPNKKIQPMIKIDHCKWYGGDCGGGEKCSSVCFEPHG